jgi:hypothetical protein
MTRMSQVRQKATATRFRHGVTVEVGRPVAEARVLGVEVFASRAGLSTRQTSVPPRRSASPIAEGLNGLPKRPPQTTSRSLQTTAPGSFLAGQVCPRATNSCGAPAFSPRRGRRVRDSAREARGAADCERTPPRGAASIAARASGCPGSCLNNGNKALEDTRRDPRLKPHVCRAVTRSAPRREDTRTREGELRLDRAQGDHASAAPKFESSRPQRNSCRLTHHRTHHNREPR